MGQAVVEGSLVPCMWLGKGDRKTVELNDRVGGPSSPTWQQLIGKGYVLLVGRIDEPAPKVEAEPPVVEADEPNGEDGDVDGERPADPPRKNASRADWAAFLRARGVDFPDGDEDAGELWAGRDDLIIIWQQASGGS